MLSSWVQIKDLAHLQEGANERLQVKINELSTALEDDYEIHFEIITTAGLASSAKDDFDAFEKQLSEDETLAAHIKLIDNETLQFKYDEALNMNRPYINHQFSVEAGKYMELMIGDTKAVIAAISLKECIKIPGIKDGSLFRKNVRQSLGSGNKVNKGIARTIRTDAFDFFFLHNGITAICSNIEIHDNVLSTKELNVVNGCQSLSTIFSYGENTKKANDAYIVFRFYEISDPERADKISTSTNSQSAVKARDLRSNDKSVLAMKKAYEQHFTDGYFLTKRGEKADPTKYNTNHMVNLTDLGKELIAWHSQRPTISYSETKIFDKYFDQLFHKEYDPENIQALHDMFSAIISKWTKDNPMDLNESLLAMKAYAPYHHLYAISVVFCEINKMPESVPNPAIALKKLRNSDLVDYIINMTGTCLNAALESASDEARNSEKIFSPQNWIKAKASLRDLRNSVRQSLQTLKLIPQGKEVVDKLNSGLVMEKTDFETRWSAD